MSRWGTWLGAALLVCLFVGGVFWATRSEPRAGARAQGPDAFGRDSQRFLPAELAGLYLGMTPAELSRARPHAQRLVQADETSAMVYDEPIGPALRALYFFGRRSLLLEKVQVAQQLGGVDAIPPRVTATSARHGAASGVWDCPGGDGQHVPTRRFSWTRGAVGAMDVYLILGDKVSATLYVAPAMTIRDALAQARCVPTPPDRLTAFPVPPPTSGAVRHPGNPR